MSRVRARTPSLPGSAALRLAVMAMLVVALGAMPAAGQSEPGRENRVVLRVNDRIVTLYEYQRALAVQIRDIRNAPGLTDPRRQELLGEAGRRYACGVVGVVESRIWQRHEGIHKFLLGAC